MFDKESRRMQWLGIGVLTLIVVTSVGYQINVLVKQMQPVSHERALQWSTLDEAYKVIIGTHTLLYAHSLKKLQAMDGERVTIYGYMFPIEQGEEHRRFLVSPRSSSCSFCMPVGVSHLVQVTMDEAIPYQRTPMLLAGEFSISDGKKTGFAYSLLDAEQIPE